MQARFFAAVSLGAVVLATFAFPVLAQPTGCAPLTPGVADGTFEAGAPWSDWTVQSSTNYGTPLCDTGCGGGGGTASPYSGANWAWFGGSSLPEAATLGQSLTIPAGPFRFLRFQLRIGAVSAPYTDTLTVSMDGAPLAAFAEPATAEADYTLRYLDVTSWADGASHALLFTYDGPTTEVANFSVDEIELVGCTTPVELRRLRIE